MPETLRRRRSTSPESPQVSDRAVRGWRTGDIRPERYDRLAQLVTSSSCLSSFLVSALAAPRSRLLDGQRPIDLSPRIAGVRSAAGHLSRHG